MLSEAGKSLGYRLEYWQATWAMIGDHPWFGCGPGNFQDAYMRYKLPQASEEIQDPHNLFFEVWATAGTPAMLALLAVLGLFGWQTWRRAEPQSGSAAGDPSTKVTTIGLMIGAAAGLLLANLVGPLVGLDFAGAMAWASAWGSARLCSLDYGPGFAVAHSRPRWFRSRCWCWSFICWRPAGSVFPAWLTAFGSCWRWV